MALPLSLKAHRSNAAKTLRRLTEQWHKDGIDSMTFEQIVTIEEFGQMGDNREFEAHLSEGEIKKLAEARRDRALERVKSGQPPFETTQFDRWNWDRKKEVYRWSRGKEGAVNPLGLGKGEWKPKVISHPITTVEGQQPGRLR